MKNKNYQEIQEEIQKFNHALHGKYDRFFAMEKDALIDALIPHVGGLHTVNKLTEEELQSAGRVVAVDGSTVRKGGAFPHYVELFQGLALVAGGEEYFTQKLYSPLIDRGNMEEKERIHDQYLAEVELEAALLAADSEEVGLIIMDGGLLRYKISAVERWMELRDLCLARDILLCGAIKDIKTHMIGEELGHKGELYDREILAGKLDRGDFFLVHDEKNEVGKEGFSSGFYRPSKHNDVVGIDTLSEQREEILYMASFLYTLTPENSRGVPLLIDIVDEGCKLSPQFLTAMLEENLDRVLLEKLLISERERRN